MICSDRKCEVRVCCTAARNKKVCPWRLTQRVVLVDSSHRRPQISNIDKDSREPDRGALRIINVSLTTKVAHES